MNRVLIVDDEERIVNSLYGLLSETFEFEIYRAFSAVEAEQLLHRVRFDIVISDICMPQMNGIELLAIIKRLWPKAYVILLTAYNRFDYAYAAMKYDRVEYLLKIESYDEIIRSVQAKVEAIEAENQREIRYLENQSAISEIHGSLTRFFLKKTVLQGVSGSERREWEEIQMPIDLQSPVLLAVASLSEYDFQDYDRIISKMEAHLKNALMAYHLELYSLVSDLDILWVVQGTEASREFTAQENVLFVREALDQLVQNAEQFGRCHLSLVYFGEYIEWSQSHLAYRSAVSALRQMGKESGMQELQANARDVLKSNAPEPLGLSEINILYELSQYETGEAFLAELSRRLMPIRALTYFPVSECVSACRAVLFLLSEVCRDYGLTDALQTEIAQLELEHFTTSARWVDQVLKVAGQLVESRCLSQKRSVSWQVEQVDSFIEQHYAENLTLTSMAENIHYNPSYLSRIYKQYTGKNLMTQLNDVRIRHALELLVNSGLRISEIAQVCGICSTKYFGEVFKKSTGMTPNEYRQKHRTGI